MPHFQIVAILKALLLAFTNSRFGFLLIDNVQLTISQWHKPSQLTIISQPNIAASICSKDDFLFYCFAS